MMKASKLSPFTESTILEFLDTALNLVRRFDQALSIRGTSFSEYRLLKTLSDSEVEGCSRIDLAQSVSLTPSAVTRALKPLEKLGYVDNKRNARDARQSLAIITPAGRELLRDAQAVLDDLFRTLPINALSQQQVEGFKRRLLDLR